LIWDLLSKSLSTNKSKSKKINNATAPLTPTLVKTVPILERVEAVGILRSDGKLGESDGDLNSLRFYTGGEKGVVKLWSGKKGEIVQQLGQEKAASSSEELEEQRQISNIL